MADIARTQGDINGLNAAKEKYGPLNENATEKERAAYLDKLRNSDEYKAEMQKFGTGSSIQQGIQAVTAAVQGLAGGDIAKAIAGGSAPYLAEVIHNMTTDPATGKVNTEANLMAHAVLGAVVAQVQGSSALAGASGAVMGEFIAQQLYPGVDRDKLSEDQKQTISALGTLAAGLAGGVVGDSTADAVAGAQAGKNASENNNLNLGGLGSYGQAASTLGISMMAAGASAEEISTALSKNAQGDLPESANITKVIVDGYKNGALIAGAGYLGPVASAGKMVAGSVIGAIANGTYQWFDMNQPGNENKTYDYWSTTAMAVTGALAPGRGIGENVSIAAGAAVFTDGPDVVAVSGATVGALAGGDFGKYVPVGVNKITGESNIPDFVYDVIGTGGSEFVNGFTKEALSSAPTKKPQEEVYDK
ncbi:filamentous hemagglutinin [Pantoea alhagi]|uniref:VENN motif pre-toxin domain-containing protein n=1 Tax=Mixta sp. BE291 TaxID=3158787 RepID=UPI0028600929|nr:filamentous hemagglutinin [Pantoea alhagi]